MKHTLLIVDDVQENIDILVNLLGSKYNTKVAINGESAVKIATSKYLPDLFLLDILMPDMDGFKVCKRIRAEKPKREIPIIFLTAKNDEDSIVQGFQVGSQDYVSKLFHPEELLSAIRDAFGTKKQKRTTDRIKSAI